MSTAFPQLQTTSTAGETSSIASSFLTPPLTPLDDHDIPYRPSYDDRTSLNMKRKHHKHAKSTSPSGLLMSRSPRLRDRGGSNAHMVANRTATALGELNRCRSLQESYHHNFDLISRSSADAFPGNMRDNPQVNFRERRWTLPSKSEPTRGLTPLISTVKQATFQQGTESPAIITLRRATNDPTPRKSELTFFPEPTFSHERDGLLCYLVSTFSRPGTLDNTTSALLENGKRNSRSNSVDSAVPSGTITMPAATVCTETTVDASLTMPEVSSNNLARRRCSTKYTSGNNVYEIIWDENDSVSITDSSSRPSVGNVDRRRSSLAASKLEAQLARKDESSRKHSNASNKSTGKTSIKSMETFPEQALTVDKLEAIFPRLLHKTGLRDLPRSRAGRQRNSTVCSMTVEGQNPETLYGRDVENHRSYLGGIGFFPPLTSRRNSGVAGKVLTSDAEVAIADTPSSYTSSPQDQAYLTSMIGSSNHARRRSSGYVTAAMDMFRQPFKAINSRDMDVGSHYEDDQQPLLE